MFERNVCVTFPSRLSLPFLIIIFFTHFIAPNDHSIAFITITTFKQIYLFFEIFQHSLINRPQQFNPEALAARRQRELEQSQSLAAHTATATALPSATASIVNKNNAEEQWVCPACTFSNPASARKCVVCSTEKGRAVEMKVGSEVMVVVMVVVTSCW